jgi:hypothetical protein
MNCIEFKQALEASVDTDRATDVAAMQAHCSECAPCQNLFEQFALLDRAIPLWRDRMPRVDVADAVLAQLAFDEVPKQNSSANRSSPTARREGVGRSQRSAGRRIFAAITTAVAVIVLGTWITWRPVPPEQFAPRVEPLPAMAEANSEPNPWNPANEPDGSVERDEAEVEPELTMIVRDAGRAYLVLVNGAADAVADGAVLMPASDFSIESAFDDRTSVESRDEDWSEELKPIGSGLGEAVDFLFEAVALDSSPTI